MSEKPHKESSFPPLIFSVPLIFLPPACRFLIEHSEGYDGDDVWSDFCDGRGSNWLGLNLMRVRDELRQAQLAQQGQHGTEATRTTASSTANANANATVIVTAGGWTAFADAADAAHPTERPGGGNRCGRRQCTMTSTSI